MQLNRAVDEIKQKTFLKSTSSSSEEFLNFGGPSLWEVGGYSSHSHDHTKHEAVKELRMNKVINERRFAFVRSLYHIRKTYPQMGLFQPDFIYVIFDLRKMMPSKYNRTNYDIRQAVDNWCEHPEAATAEYGHISK
jgi:hypothetical protein